MKKYGKYILGIVLVVAMTASVAACRETEAVELDRTFEYTTEESTSAKETNTEETTEKESRTQESTSEKESTSARETTTAEEVTTEEGPETYFGDEKSVFNTLPLFEAGTFEEHFDRLYLEGIRFSGVTLSDYQTYYQAVLNGGTYTLNSTDGNRAYFADGSNMCITLIYKDGIMLIEAGKNFWDILTYAEEETVAPTKPAETTDSRYGYFDNKDMIFAGLPYFTEGIFTGYESVDRGGILTFSEVSQEQADAYTDILLANGFMLGGTVGNVTYFTSDTILVAVTFEGSALNLRATAN